MNWTNQSFTRRRFFKLAASLALFPVGGGLKRVALAHEEDKKTNERKKNPYVLDPTEITEDQIDQQFTINAFQWGYRPSVIKVKRGEVVKITLKSLDTAHGLYLDGYQLNLKSTPAQPAEIIFRASLAGSFRFRCSVACGDFHPFMIGKLVVMDNLPFMGALGLSGLVALGTLGWLSYRGRRRSLDEGEE